MFLHARSSCALLYGSSRAAKRHTHESYEVPSRLSSCRFCRAFWSASSGICFDCSWLTELNMERWVCMSASKCCNAP